MNWFLIFPKLSFNGSSGLLIGEFILFIVLSYNLIKQYRLIVYTNEVFLLTILAFYWFVVGSLFGTYQSPPILGWLYFIKISMVLLSSFLVCFDFSCDDYLHKYITKPFFVVSISSFIVYVIYYIGTSPSVGDILWGYALGTRLIPIFGMGINVSNFSLTAIGGASGNLLGSLSLIALIVVLHEDRYRLKYFYVAGVVFFVSMSMSRGSLITLFLYIFYFLLFKKKSIISLVFFVLLLMFLSLVFSDSVGIITRISDTFTQDGLDPSSLGRLENYYNAYKVWVSTPLTFFWGIGSDESYLTQKIGAGFIESFYLGLIFCCGVFGCLLFSMFIYVVWSRRHRNKYALYLSEYLFFQSLLQWTVTGGDFWGPVNVYVMSVLLGLSSMHVNRVVSG